LFLLSICDENGEGNLGKTWRDTKLSAEKGYLQVGLTDVRRKEIEKTTVEAGTRSNQPVRSVGLNPCSYQHFE